MAVWAAENRPFLTERDMNDGWSGEVMVFCPACKAVQTVWVYHNRMSPTRKFTQKQGRVYHDCGAVQPCHLYWI